ncbi:MAG: hypothetical protein IH888_05325 [Planctomycetes bacterium]|nr:hypothetical protein [Planctomycetota bacterium]
MVLTRSKVFLRAVPVMLLAIGVHASAAIVPFTEDFTVGPANWFDSPGTGLLDWVAAGGPDGGAYVSTVFNFANSAINDAPVMFRGQDNLDSSADAFVGDWITDGVTLFSFFLRHNAPGPVTIFSRFASPANFPGAIALEFAPIPPNIWTEISIPIEPGNPQFISFEGSDFNTVFGNIGNLQLGLIVSESLAGLDADLTFDLDKVSIIPAPGAAAILAVGGWLVGGRRRRRHTRRQAPPARSARMPGPLAAALLTVAGVASASGEVIQVSFQTPTLDRWMYPFNSNPGFREFASIFGALNAQGFVPEFDNRDGQMIIGFDTSAVVPSGLGPERYTIISAALTVTVLSDLTFEYDPTPDPYTSWLDPADPEFTADPDPGRPLEVFGAGFRNGFTASTFQEDGPFCVGCNCFFGICKSVRNVYPIDFDQAGMPRDVSNNVDERFDPRPFAVGQNAGLTPGQLVPVDTVLGFEIDVSDPAVAEYLAGALDEGLLELVIASIYPAEKQQTGTFPKLYTRENLLVQLQLVDAAGLELTVEVGVLGDIDGDGIVGVPDLLALLASWGACPTPPEPCPADLDHDGSVSVPDLLILLANWG